MNLRRVGKSVRVLIDVRFYSSICLKGLRKTTKFWVMIGGIMVDIRTEYFSDTSAEQCSYANYSVWPQDCIQLQNISSDYKIVTVERTTDSRCHSALISACRSLNSGDEGAVWSNQFVSIIIECPSVCLSDPTRDTRVLTNNQTDVLAHRLVALLRHVIEYFRKLHVPQSF
jgi:hypothetical protein